MKSILFLGKLIHTACCETKNKKNKKRQIFRVFTFLNLQVVSRDTYKYGSNILIKTQVYSKQDIPCIAQPKRDGMSLLKYFDL